MVHLNCSGVHAATHIWHQTFCLHHRTLLLLLMRRWVSGNRLFDCLILCPVYFRILEANLLELSAGDPKMLFSAEPVRLGGADYASLEGGPELIVGPPAGSEARSAEAITCLRLSARLAAGILLSGWRVVMTMRWPHEHRKAIVRSPWHIRAPCSWNCKLTFCRTYPQSAETWHRHFPTPLRYRTEPSIQVSS